ncbi:MAG: hypothetical protein M1462_04165 [Candidatus Thermoplasmatota archaeon]|nr:hypothetical protein [Candidatus Thermoplasmatota archaeon]
MDRRVNKPKHSKRVKAGNEAYNTRLKHERNKDVINAFASFIPGYGFAKNGVGAIRKQRKIDSRGKH